MKSIMKLTAVIALSALVTGCAGINAIYAGTPKSGVKIVEGSDTNLYNGNKGITVNKIAFEEVAEADLPESLKGKIETAKLQKGYIYEKKGGYFYIAIFSGEKPSGGYSIKALSIEDNEGATNIFVEETTPKKGDSVTMAITYPYTVIKASGITPDIALFNKDGSNFNAPPAPASSEAKVITAEAQYIGQIDNNSIEVKLNGETVAMRLGTSLVDSFKNFIIEKNSKINIKYYKNPEGQYILEYLEEKEY